MYSAVTCLFHQIFLHLEEQQYLDHTSDFDLYCLHYVYLPTIQRALLEFVNGWNQHRIRSEAGYSPQQLFWQSMLSTSSDFSFNSGLDVDDGTDPSDADGRVLVPHINYVPSQEKMPQVEQLINPLDASDSYGMDLCRECKRILR